MNFFISGVMQGSLKELEIQGQEYRQVITQAIKEKCPEAKISDPFSLFPDSVTYDDQRAKEVLFEMADTAGSSDILISYLPEASMGTALEMIRAYDNGKTVLCITTLDKNWFIRAVSTKLFPSLKDFCAWMKETNLEELIGKPTE